MLEEFVNQDYQFGFTTDIETDLAPKGLTEEIIRLISQNKNEPEFLLEFRLKAFKHFQTLIEPRWVEAEFPPIDFQNSHYYSAPKQSKTHPQSIDEIDPELKKTFDRLGVPLLEQKHMSGIAVDAIFDSVSVATTYKEKLLEVGVIFCPISEAVLKYPDLIKKYLGRVVDYKDNFYAALNSAVFTDGSFVYIPPNTACPMELSSYFRINTEESGQFERTLIVCDAHSSVSYLEGCTAPKFDTNQLHAAVVELVALDHSEIKYSTVQNWYAGDENGKGGIYNFVTKRALCEGDYSKVSWTQVETGSAITWKYPSCILKGDHSVGEFYSVALTNHYQQADTGTKMIHLGQNTKSTIISKGISAGYSKNTYRGLVHIDSNAKNSRNFSKCDSMLVGTESNANTFPYITGQNASSKIEHEATTSKISEDQLFYFQQRGIQSEEAISAIINGFCKDVFKQLPAEFAVEASKLLGLKLENSVG